MQSLRLKNLRGFKDTGNVSLKDINLFVGQNSSGKSTFLRTFPLLRQSILKDTKGPILWYDDSLVDFGSYSEAKNRHSDLNEGIHFSFTFTYNNESKRHLYYDNNQIVNGALIKVDIEIFEKSKVGYIGNLIIDIDDQKIIIEANENGTIKLFSINGNKFNTQDISTFLFKSTSTGLLPIMYFFVTKDKIINDDFYLNKCKEKLKKIIGNRLKNDYRILQIINSLKLGSKKTILHSLKEEHSITTLSKKTSIWTVETPEFIDVNDYIIACKTPAIINIIDKKIKEYFEECRYIAPIRAKAVRYYRRQDLSVSEVDAYGDNLHMFLDNLNAKQKTSYQNFVKEIFGFIPETDSSFGHITLNIKNNDGDTYNIADLGFGYSQILPIITKLWDSFTEKNSKNLWASKNRIITLLIEQPELHLHPAMQAQLADAFLIAIDKAKENNVKLRLIIETHSSVIINRIGRRIIENKVDADNVNVTLFEYNSSSKQNEVRCTSFNGNGVLIDWPIGFFEPKN